MKELDQFTVEQLSNFIESDHAQCGDVAALARIALSAKQVEPVGWIKCSDQIPEDDTLCLGVDEFGVIWTMHFDDGEWQADTGHVDDLKISHWMPLPAAPTSLLEGE
ncbi:DUF551 domain-containing protein [Yersinia enterocolitica]|uniref:DUF551 domain-containing protein n=1 Tax=Yersinia enterocolitica TaxID=630 RepID=UPI003D04F93F